MYTNNYQNTSNNQSGGAHQQQQQNHHAPAHQQQLHYAPPQQQHQQQFAFLGGGGGQPLMMSQNNNNTSTYPNQQQQQPPSFSAMSNTTLLPPPHHPSHHQHFGNNNNNTSSLAPTPPQYYSSSIPSSSGYTPNNNDNNGMSMYGTQQQHLVQQQQQLPYYNAPPTSTNPYQNQQHAVLQPFNNSGGGYNNNNMSSHQQQQQQPPMFGSPHGQSHPEGARGSGGRGGGGGGGRGGGGGNQGGGSVFEVYDPDYSHVTFIPAHKIHHKPPNAKRLSLCRRYHCDVPVNEAIMSDVNNEKSGGGGGAKSSNNNIHHEGSGDDNNDDSNCVPGSCPRGPRCRYVHAELEGCKRLQIHVSYVWRTPEECSLYSRVVPMIEADLDHWVHRVAVRLENEKANTNTVPNASSPPPPFVAAQSPPSTSFNGNELIMNKQHQDTTPPVTPQIEATKPLTTITSTNTPPPSLFKFSEDAVEGRVSKDLVVFLRALRFPIMAPNNRPPTSDVSVVNMLQTDGVAHVFPALRRMLEYRAHQLLLAEEERFNNAIISPTTTTTTDNLKEGVAAVTNTKYVVSPAEEGASVDLEVLLSHCAHYYFNRICHRGERCHFVHCLFVNSTANAAAASASSQKSMAMSVNSSGATADAFGGDEVDDSTNNGDSVSKKANSGASATAKGPKKLIRAPLPPVVESNAKLTEKKYRAAMEQLAKDGSRGGRDGSLTHQQQLKVEERIRRLKTPLDSNMTSNNAVPPYQHQGSPPAFHSATSHIMPQQQQQHHTAMMMMMTPSSAISQQPALDYSSTVAPDRFNLMHHQQQQQHQYQQHSSPSVSSNVGHNSMSQHQQHQQQKQQHIGQYPATTPDTSSLASYSNNNVMMAVSGNFEGGSDIITPATSVGTTAPKQHVRRGTTPSTTVFTVVPSTVGGAPTIGTGSSQNTVLDEKRRLSVDGQQHALWNVMGPDSETTIRVFDGAGAATTTTNSSAGSNAHALLTSHGHGNGVGGSSMSGMGAASTTSTSGGNTHPFNASVGSSTTASVQSSTQHHQQHYQYQPPVPLQSDSRTTHTNITGNSNTPSSLNRFSVVTPSSPSTINSKVNVDVANSQHRTKITTTSADNPLAYRMVMSSGNEGVGVSQSLANTTTNSNSVFGEFSSTSSGIGGGGVNSDVGDYHKSRTSRSESNASTTLSAGTGTRTPVFHHMPIQNNNTTTSTQSIHQHNDPNNNNTNKTTGSPTTPFGGQQQQQHYTWQQLQQQQQHGFGIGVPNQSQYPTMAAATSHHQMYSNQNTTSPFLMNKAAPSPQPTSTTTTQHQQGYYNNANHSGGFQHQ